MVLSEFLADYADWNNWPNESLLHTDGLNDSQPHYVSNSAESEQLPAAFLAFDGMISWDLCGVQWEYGNEYDYDKSRPDPSVENTPTTSLGVRVVNQYSIGPSEPSQLTVGAFREITPMTDALLYSLLGPSPEALLQTSCSHGFYYLTCAECSAAGLYVLHTDQSDDTNLGLLQEQAVAVLGNQQSSLYPNRHFNQQGRKREVNVRGRYDCDLCGKDYASTESLRNHQRKKHEERKGILDPDHI